MIGGEDDAFASARRRDRSLERKTQRLLGKFRKLFPDIPIEPGFAWAGTFADSEDGLPYIGQHPGFPNAWFAACYGGNGILFGVAAADIIRDGCLGLPNDSARLFRLDR